MTTSKQLDNLPSLGHKHCGRIDEKGFRIGPGCQLWAKDDVTNRYYGNFVNNNLHGRAVYIIDKTEDQAYFDGFFHCNNLEGYGKVIYSNKNSFEGLFKEHLRFGPGVLNYPDGTHDVGLWNGDSLRRLTVSIGEEFVPKLGLTSSGRAKLLKFRSLVDVAPDDVTVSDDQLRLYNLHVRNPESLFFNKAPYSGQDNVCTIDVHISEEEFRCSSWREEPPEDLQCCCCFVGDADTFRHLSVQLYEVELKLQSLLQQRENIKKQLSVCRYCCTNMVQRDTKADQPEEVSSDPRISSEEQSLPHDTDSTHMITSEIEINTVFYTNSSSEMGEGKESSVGAPCNEVVDTNNKCFNTSCTGGSEYEEPGLVELRTCICDNMMVDNVDYLQGKLKEVEQQEEFYGVVKTTLRRHLDVEFLRLEMLSTEERRFTKKVAITNLLAWNNEELFVEMLRHCFRHRCSETNVSFNVQNLLTSHRHYFNPPGIHEIACRTFLKECGKGNDKNIISSLKRGNINPDLCDARGNTGLMLAAARDFVQAVVMLVNCGAKVDVVNDEGLTPLNMALLRYLSVKFKVVDWEKGFLKEDTGFVLSGSQWFPVDSLLSVYDNIEGVADSSRTTNDTEEGITLENSQVEQTRYLFTTDFVRIHHQIKDKAKNKIKASTSKSKKQKSKKERLKNKEEEEQKPPAQDKREEKKLDRIKRTVITLLNCGTDPNMGRVPMQALLLAAFTDDSDFVYGLLNNNANPNVTTDNSLTALHIVASLQPTVETLKMCEVLMIFGANPDLRTAPDHWLELRPEVLGEGFWNTPDEGKTVLQLLSLREDFINDTNNILAATANILVLKGCRTEELYLGHTALSLAVLRGNKVLIKTLLETGLVDPHQLLGNNMGNALTVLVLNRFASSADKVEIAKTLIEGGLNPLCRIGEFENAISFMENERLQLVEETKKKTKSVSTRGSSRSTRSRSMKSKSSRASSKDTKVKTRKDAENYIVESARKFLFKHIQGKVVKYLYALISEGFVDPLTVAWTQFVTSEEGLQILYYLFQFRALKLRCFDFEAINDFLCYIKIQKGDDQLLTKDETEKLEELTSLSWQRDAPTRPNLPEVDPNEDRYNVCFHCLKSKDKTLRKCPRCELVFFCSQECNKSAKGHPCNTVFYLNEEQPSRLEALLALVNKMKHDRHFFQSQISMPNPLQAEPMKDALNNIDRISSILQSGASTSKTKVHDASSGHLTTVFLKPSFNEFLYLATKVKTKRVSIVSKDVSPDVVSRDETVKNKRESSIKSITLDQNYYMSLLSKIFADFNLPLLLLPYACYKDGQVYYKMMGGKKYSAPDFYKLTIPK